jgi:hypothetical protein
VGTARRSNNTMSDFHACEDYRVWWEFGLLLSESQPEQEKQKTTFAPLLSTEAQRRVESSDESADAKLQL